MSMQFDDDERDFHSAFEPDAGGPDFAASLGEPDGDQAPAKLTFAPEHLSRKFFTVDEANRALVYLRPVVGDVMRTYRRIVHLRRRMDHASDGATETRLEREYDGCMRRLGDFVDELHAVGVELRDFELGLLDFPSRFKRREIFLTWQPGDERVEHWHEFDDTHGGRQPMNLLKAG